MLNLSATVAAGMALYLLLVHLVRVRHQAAGTANDAFGRIETVRGDVERLRIAHDHYVEGADRRLEAVEVAAAEAAQEARIVSVQLCEIAEALAKQSDILDRLRAATVDCHRVRTS
jgi:hypothetical protein